MSLVTDSEQSLADDIVGDGTYEASAPEQLKFLPWHRPRKQFVRQRQWSAEIERLLDDCPITDGKLKYLGLPGT
jgi:hypothetical protein